MVQQEGDPVSLGPTGPVCLATCPRCERAFRVVTPAFTVIVFREAEISEEDADQLDYFCSWECAEKYADVCRNRAPPTSDFDPIVQWLPTRDGG